MNETNKSIVRRLNLEFIQGRSLEVADEILADTFVDHTAAPGMPSGREGVKAFFAMMWQAFPDMKVEIFNQVAEGDTVITHKAFHGTHDGTFGNRRPYPQTGPNQCDGRNSSRKHSLCRTLGCGGSNGTDATTRGHSSPRIRLWFY